jgi:hypothetical protein
VNSVWFYVQYALVGAHGQQQTGDQYFSLHVHCRCLKRGCSRAGRARAFLLAALNNAVLYAAVYLSYLKEPPMMSHMLRNTITTSCIATLRCLQLQVEAAYSAAPCLWGM